MRERSLFYRVVKDENSLTELICNLLKYRSLRIILAKQLSQVIGKRVDEFSFKDVSTQASDDSGTERPDIRIETDACTVLIESKIGNTPLTVAQKAGYRNALERNGVASCYLVFLVPEGYVDLAQIKKLISDHSTQNQKIAVLYWGDLIEEIEESGLAETNEIFADFVGLLKSWFVLNTIQFSKEGLEMLFTKELGSTYYDLLVLIEGIYESMRSTHKVKWESDTYGYGFAVRDSQGVEMLWLGIDYEFWRETGYALCVAVRKPKVLADKSIIRDLAKPEFDNEHWDIYGISNESLNQKLNSRFLRDKLNTMYQHLTARKHRKKRRA